jgi:hypothetical protein
MSSPAGAALVPPPKTVLDDILQSILTPGAGPGLVATINGSLLVLIVVLLCMLLFGFGEWHAVVLLFLATGLLASFNYFIGEVRKAEAGTAATGTAESGTTSPVSTSKKDR